MLIEKRFPFKLTKYFYILASILIGFLFISFFSILIFNFIFLIYEVEDNVKGYALLSFVLFICIYSIINSLFIRKRKISIHIDGIKNNIKAVQLSDIHLGTINQKKYLEKIVKMTNKEKPDVVFITGDLVDGSAPINEHMIDPINDIKAPIYYVIGNHEIYEGLDKIMPVLSKTKMKILRNEISKFQGIKIIGLDYVEGNKYVNEKIKEYKLRGPSILLYHAPSIKADDLSERGINLHLAGHTHSGQIFPFNLFVRIAFPYVYGLHKSGDEKSYVNISSGAGTWGPPMRLCSSSEINVINLTKK
jgi:hypothetical protein